MKRRLCEVLFAAVILLIVAMPLGCMKKVPVTPPAPAPLADHSITFTWQQSFANNPPCSSTVTTSCISGFNEGYLSGGTTEVQLHTDLPAVCTGTTQPESCTSTFNGILPIGNVVFYVATSYNDQSGSAGVTAAATSAPVAVGADLAVNLTVKINN